VIVGAPLGDRGQGRIRVVTDLDALIGKRVALRHRVSAPHEHPLYTDAVGELAGGPSPAEVRVHTRKGTVTVARDRVFAVREIPPPRPRRPSWAAVARLETVCADAWPPLVSRPLGQWRLRAAGGFTGRANSCLVNGDPGVPLAEALDRVRGFAGEHGIRPLLQVPVGSPWHREILAAGWAPHTGHPAGHRVQVMVAPVAQLAAPSRPADLRLRVDGEPATDWWPLAGDPPVDAGQRHVLLGAGAGERGFGLALTPDGATVGAVRLVALDEHLHLSRLAVDPAHRRRGVALALLDAAAAWAVGRARWCVLQVADENTAALALYRRLGFRPHHEYTYLLPASGLVSAE
jgi:N-acetylglutamate synthase